MAISIRRARPQDADKAGQICYEAFRAIGEAHGFPPDIPAPAMAVGLLHNLFGDPGVYCVVAEENGEIAGSNCLDERSPIAGVGPITVSPSAQNHGIGRALMNDVLARARERNFRGTRLVQAAFHNRSLCLYTTLGFDAREPLSVMQGPAIKKPVEGCSTRRATDAGLDPCNRLCQAIHGHDRGGELLAAIKNGTATVVERKGRITGYATLLGFFGHAVGETSLDLEALIGSADGFAGPGILVPTRNAELFRWCLANGLRLVEPATLMSLGFYQEPAGAYLPSILF